jgi:class 3 adenylate cyclase
LGHPDLHVEGAMEGNHLTRISESSTLRCRAVWRIPPALPREHNVALHTGPLFRIFDPVTEKFTFYGTHVNRTARLEPIVRPRHIFATEEFAASLIAENQDRFSCDYIGTMQLAKHFGDARLYRLRWTMAE